MGNETKDKLYELAKEMEKVEKEKSVISVMSEEEKQKRLGELAQIRVLLSKVKDRVVKLEEVKIEEKNLAISAPKVRVEGRKIKCLYGFYFSVSESSQRVDRIDEDDYDVYWYRGEQVFLDNTVTEGKEWMNIRFALINENQSMFICEVYSRTFQISDEEVVQLLSAVPIKSGEVIDNFETFVSYSTWYITRYIRDKKQMQVMKKMQAVKKKKSNIFRRILKK